MVITEVIPTTDVIKQLIALTQQWEKENITTGYIHNNAASFTGYRIFYSL